MKKILVMPSSLDNLGKVLNSDADGVILPLEGLAINSNIYFTIEDIKSIINLTSKEICVSINKIMHTEDLDFLEEALVRLNKLNIRKIFFYDVAVINICKRLNIKKDLVIFQEHLNASLYSNNFYKDRGIAYSTITNDITLEEINEISKHNKLILISYGYLPIFNSRRHLVSNYLDYIHEHKLHKIYYITNGEDRYPILEEKDGTTIFTKEPINLINDVDKIDVEYLILNAFNIKTSDFMEVLDDFIKERKTDKEEYVGFLNTKTVYKVDDYE
ncbi:MAG: U32 family peptidase [Bacilli bacterium]|nr:U32 family peptidase [Bacilli bacterium]